MIDIAGAAAILRRGGLVAFPTETVYGLGADATNPQAVARIFAAKGRPSTNPLIIHVADESVAQRYAAVWPESASRLARRFWPGPLTMVLPKRPVIVDGATAGLATLGLRCPDHPVAIELLKAFDGPVAAPSANRSTRISPTTAQHVRDELGNAVDMVLDGGACAVGIESTVLDLTGATPTILRPGAVTAAMLEAEIGPVALVQGVTHITQAAASPGQHAIHYAPATPTYRFELRDMSAVIDWCRGQGGEPFAVLALSSASAIPPHAGRTLAMPPNPAEYARTLYATLRSLDDLDLRAILIELPPPAPEWLALRDRLVRAARPFS